MRHFKSDLGEATAFYAKATVFFAGISGKPDRPLANHELAHLVKTLTRRNDADDIDRAILLITATGGRLSEVVGLRKQDVHHSSEGDTTFVSLEVHDARGLKNAGSFMKPAGGTG